MHLRFKILLVHPLIYTFKMVSHFVRSDCRLDIQADRQFSRICLPEIVHLSLLQNLKQNGTEEAQVSQLTLKISVVLK